MAIKSEKKSSHDFKITAIKTRFKRFKNILLTFITSTVTLVGIQTAVGYVPEGLESE